MNLFKLNYCPLCKGEFDEEDQCAYSNFRNAKIEISGLKFNDHYYWSGGFLLYKDNNLAINLNSNKKYNMVYNYSLKLYEGILDIELTESNLEKIIYFLNDKSELMIKNLMFL